LVSGPLDGIDQVVVIPALAEERLLYRTLASIALNPGSELQRTLVLCVVNNRPDAPRKHVVTNLKTIDRIEGLITGVAGDDGWAVPLRDLRLGLVDATGAGREASGVGEARRIGLDRGLAIVADGRNPRGPLISLDADTTVEPDYLRRLRKHFAGDRAWAAVVDFEHPLPDDDAARDVIVQYESYLRYHSLGLALAGSPYSFPTVGSTMACRSDAYAAVSGMNRRKAAEDFYFLQELQKTGGVEVLTSTRVYPSARTSERVPFGTGMSMVNGLARRGDIRRVYHPKTYRIIADWLAAVADRPDSGVDGLLDAARRISSELGRFLVAAGFEGAWPKIERNASAEAWLMSQFHRWFDGFRTLKLIHHLRDNGLPDVPLYEAVEEIVTWAGIEEHRESIRAAASETSARIPVLERLREIQRGRAGSLLPLF
jgi:hypothetical protein